jgi:RNA polymerase sigma-70 factor (ECF subfamily)
MAKTAAACRSKPDKAGATQEFSRPQTSECCKIRHPPAVDFLARFSELSSTELLRKCAGSRDLEAWKEFIRRFQPVIASAVARTARHWIEPPRQLLDDLVQETYLKLCENNSRMLRSFRPQQEDSFYSYLKVVAANVVRDHFKSAMADKRGASQTDAMDDHHVQIDPKTSGADSATAIHRNLQLEQIDNILLRAPTGKDRERNRTIFWLRHQQGLTASEIAAIPSIGLSTEGVESVLLRLAIMIRGHMGKGRGAA